MLTPTYLKCETTRTTFLSLLVLCCLSAGGRESHLPSLSFIALWLRRGRCNSALDGGGGGAVGLRAAAQRHEKPGAHVRRVPRDPEHLRARPHWQLHAARRLPTAVRSILVCLQTTALHAINGTKRASQSTRYMFLAER